MNITNEMIERAIEMSKANIEMEDDVKLTKDNIDDTKKRLIKQFNLGGNINGQQLGQIHNRGN
ncbi:MAG: hypothetical protein SPI91_01290 [Bacilli bacterium]|jgi:hypothetical protein|nr:hypothetical protein [Clostridium sp.]MDY6015076.1 hypothetical protein [Bacilli bacterium]CCZ60083.1 unknown [Clostridium sp. CAG:710]